MVFIAGKFNAEEILCQLPPHTLRIDLQARRWKSDNDPDSAITDTNDNGIPIEFILLGFTPYFGNLGMRTHEEFIRISYIGVAPSHRLLPPRCVCTSIISGKSSQKNFISYFQTLYNNRINVGEVITSTKFVQRSFNERDPVTGADGAKINYNVVEFKDRPTQNDDEKKLIEDVGAWLEASADLVASALRAVIPGSNLVELPMGEDHEKIKTSFIEQNPKRLEAGAPQGLAALPADAGVPGKKVSALPTADSGKKKELTDAQLKALKDAGLSV